MSFIEEFARLKICLFRYSSFVRIKQNELFSYSFYTTVFNDGLHEPYLLLRNSSFILTLSESHRGYLIWVKLIEIQKQKFESQFDVINPFPNL